MSKFFNQKNFINILFKSISQIMLQENRWTGFLFLISLFIGSWKYCLAALSAGFIGNITATILKYDFRDISKGLYGFSPALFGVALIFFFKPTIIIWGLVVVGSILTCMLQHFFIKRNFPAYTFPFIVVTWLFVFMLRSFPEIIESNLIYKTSSVSEFDMIAMGFRSFGQVVFQEGLIPGILCFIAVFINSKSAALYTLAAVIVTGYIAYLIGQPLNIVYSGYYGFNVVLSAIVFSGPRKIDFLWVAIATILTFLITLFFTQTLILNSFGGILTFPFVIGTWFTYVIKRLEGFTQSPQS